MIHAQPWAAREFAGEGRAHFEGKDFPMSMKKLFSLAILAAATCAIASERPAAAQCCGSSCSTRSTYRNRSGPVFLPRLRGRIVNTPQQTVQPQRCDSEHCYGCH